jgi:hypothetical protein
MIPVSPTWIQEGDVAYFIGVRLRGPMYFRCGDIGRKLNFVVDDGLEIRFGSLDQADTTMSDYSKWSPDRRYQYLRWIESGRPVPTQTPACFLLNHFWNLEYRLLVDDDRDNRVLSAIGTLLVQHHADPIQPGLAAAITRLLTFYPHKFGPQYFRDFWAWAYTLPGLAWTVNTLTVHLADLAALNQALPETLALATYQVLTTETSSQLTPEQFFEAFHDRFPTGLRLTPPDNVKRVQFQASHPQTASVLLAKVGEWSFDLPDFFAEPTAFAELGALGTDRSSTTTDFFEEVIVRPGKSTGTGTILPKNTEPPRTLIDQNQLAALEQETIEVDALLAQLMQSTSENRDKPKSSWSDAP